MHFNATFNIHPVEHQCPQATSLMKYTYTHQRVVFVIKHFIYITIFKHKLITSTKNKNYIKATFVLHQEVA